MGTARKEGENVLSPCNYCQKRLHSSVDGSQNNGASWLGEEIMQQIFQCILHCGMHADSGVNVVVHMYLHGRGKEVEEEREIINMFSHL